MTLEKVINVAEERAWSRVITMSHNQFPVRQGVLQTHSSDPPRITTSDRMTASHPTASNVSTSHTTRTTATLSRSEKTSVNLLSSSTSPALATSSTLTTVPSMSVSTSCRTRNDTDILESLSDRTCNRNTCRVRVTDNCQTKNINNRNKENCNIRFSSSNDSTGSNNKCNTSNKFYKYYPDRNDSHYGKISNDEIINFNPIKTKVNGCRSYTTIPCANKPKAHHQHIEHESFANKTHETHLRRRQQQPQQKYHYHRHHHHYNRQTENEEQHMENHNPNANQEPKQKRHQQQQFYLKSLINHTFSYKTFSTLSLFYLLLLHLFGPTCADICPKVCFCQAMAKHIGCAKRGLTEIPDLIPSDTRQLSLNENYFANKVLVRKNFSRLPNLVDLFLDGCGIEVITLDTFADLRHLSMLDLSNNKLRYIEDYTFRGLSLKHLFLNSNPGIQFAPKAFTGFRTVGLFLRKCGLHNMSQDAIRPLNGTLKMIWLNDNNFEYLPMEWYYLFKTLSHVRLENNPMHCNCELAWLYQMYVTNSSLFPEDVVLTCHTPRRLKTKAFNTLTLEDFQCQLPIFQGVDVLVGPHVGKLSCVARADPSPTLYWERPDGSIEMYGPSEDRAVKTTEGVLFIHNHHTSSNARYRCVANNPAGNVTFTLQVTWPPSGSTTRHLVTTVPMENSLPKSHGRSSNQSAMNMTDLTADVLFTLMELIGAVIGTFLLTFLLCILVFHFFCRQQRSMGPQDRDHSEKRRTPENHYVMADIDESSIKMMEHKDLVS